MLRLEIHGPYRLYILECGRSNVHECNCEFCDEPTDCETVLQWAVVSPPGDICARGELLGLGKPIVARLVDEGKILPPAAYPSLF